ncbi:MAG TPA: dihydrolipoyl dehydrogenase [Actinomycetota bacterium]|jgi:dihydrolipoamide dehydrogenase|nr:dihydrolipoyl dehydrogenase [Actinomycetota bacterium]
MADTFDVVVLGGGPAGYAFALRAALLNLRVAIVERDKVGGTCLHRGCIPTKALLHAAEVMDAIGDASSLGITVSDPTFEWAKVQSSKSEPIKKLHAGLQAVIKARKIETFIGNGTLAEPGTIEVDGTSVKGNHVVLAPGSYARSLPGMDPDGERIITSDDALTSESFPSKIAIIGAGAVGVEFASVYRSFGSEVTVIEALDRVIPMEDADLSKELAAAFKKRGITTHVGAKVEDVDKSDGGVKLVVSKGNKTENIEVDTVLVAVGRGPSTDGLDLERWGVRTDRGYIVIDGENRAAENVWSIGDCTAGTPQLAHVAFGMGMATAERIAGGTPITVDFQRHVPRAIYCAPEVAAVGLTEAQAKEQGYDVKVTKHSFAGNAKAQMMHAARGFAKVVVAKDGPILGMHLIGPRVTELLAESLLTVGWEAMPAEVAAFVHPHPTLSEVVGEAALEAIGKPLHG